MKEKLEEIKRKLSNWLDSQKVSSKTIKELQSKIFWILFAVTTAFCSAVAVFFMYREYVDTQSSIQQLMVQSSNIANDNRWEKNFEHPILKDNEPIERFTVLSKLPVYTIFLERGQVKYEVYQNSNEEDAKSALEIGENLLEQSGPGDIDYHGLLFRQWAWYYSSPGVFTLVNITPLKKELWESLFYTLFVLALFLAAFAITTRILVRWMTRPIEQAMIKQKQFIADASHELKTPVAVIMANAEAMEHNPDPKWLHNIEDEAQRMSDLVVSLLDLARSEQQTLELSAVSLSMVCEKECLMQEAVLYEKNLELQMEIEPDLWIKADKAKAGQLIAILLDNASKHAKKTVKVTLRKSGRYGLLEVANDGVPIPIEQRQQIFERFYRADQSRSRNAKRYGLGLAIAKNIAENHHSEIWADCRDSWTIFCWKIHLINPASIS